MKRILAVLLLALILTGCDIFVPVLPPATTPLFYPPTFTPGVRSTGTPIIFTPPPTLTASPVGPTETPTPSITPTETLTPTITLTPTDIPIFSLEASILACNTSVDISHGMGEVTNAYAIVRNIGNVSATQVCATLFASDEERAHPDKTACIALLEPGFQVTLKLTVDTAFQTDTSIRVRVQTDNGYATESAQPACTDVGMPYFDPAVINTPQPIQP